MACAEEERVGVQQQGGPTAGLRSDALAEQHWGRL